MADDGSIKLFQFLENVCRIFGVSPPQPNQKQYRINAINWFTIFFLNQFLVSTAAFLLFEANSMMEYSITFFFCLTIIASDILCLTASWQVRNIPKFIENWEAFIGKREHSTITYKDANEKIERTTALLAYCWLATIFIVTICVLIYTYVVYFILDSGEKSFFLNVPAWWPFNWKTPFGYFLAWFCQSAGIATAIIVFALFFSFNLGSSLHFIFMAEDITKDMAAFNSNLKRSEVQMELTDRFRALIQIYSDAKQCVNEFNEISEYLLFTFFSWEMVSVSSLLVTLQFQLLDDNSKLVELSYTSIIVFYTFGLIFLICELDERVTSHFEIFGQELERCDWHLLPIKLQRLYLIFLSDNQQAVYIRSYGGIKCSRETFKQITNKGFSYFMMLRQFDV